MPTTHRPQHKRALLQHQMADQIGEPVLTAEEFCHRASISPVTLWRCVRAGLITPVTATETVFKFYRASDVARFEVAG